METNERKELTLSQIQQGSFEVLLKVKEICEKLQINYYLAYGTLIGAARHSGFIPWDDDIDVWMFRKDYETFVRYCLDNKESLYPFEILNYSNTKYYPYPISRLSDSRYKTEYSNCKDYGLGLFVDLYPLDRVDIRNDKFKKKQLRKVRNICRLYDENRNFKSFLRRLYVIALLTVTFCFSRKKYIKSADISAQKYNQTKEAKHLAVCAWEFDWRPDKEQDFIGEKKELMFNGVLFQVPSNYHSVLTNHYGDYTQLPPPEQRIAHHDYKAFLK